MALFTMSTLSVCQRCLWPGRGDIRSTCSNAPHYSPLLARSLHVRQFFASSQECSKSFGLRSRVLKPRESLRKHHYLLLDSKRELLRSPSKADQSQDTVLERGGIGKVSVDVLNQENGDVRNDSEFQEFTDDSTFVETSDGGSDAPSNNSLENLDSFLLKVKENKLKEEAPIASPDSILDTLLLISPFFLWGTAMVAMKGVLPKAGPMFVASWRLIPAGLLLIWFGASRGKKNPSGTLAWISIALFGLVDASCFQGFLAEGLKRTSAGLGSVIIDSQPLTVALLAALFFGESLGFVNYFGLALGILGLLFLEVPLDFLQNALNSATDGSGLTASIGDTSFLNEFASWDRGEWRMLLAAQSMALGTVMVRWVCQYSDPFMATGWHMVLGGIPLLILSFVQQDPAVSGHIQDLDASDWMALLYTSIAGSAISYGVFFYNATRGSLTKLSSLTFLTPMFAALFGFLFLNEILTPTQILGGVITLAGVLLVNYKPTPILEVDLLEADDK